MLTFLRAVDCFESRTEESSFHLREAFHPLEAEYPIPLEEMCPYRTVFPSSLVDLPRSQESRFLVRWLGFRFPYWRATHRRRSYPAWRRYCSPAAKDPAPSGSGSYRFCVRRPVAG
jgi:hypothetical protein